MKRFYPSDTVKMRAIPHLIERLFLISWENNRDCHITMPLSLKTMEVQIKGHQYNSSTALNVVLWDRVNVKCTEILKADTI